MSYLCTFALQAQDGVAPNLEEINISDSINKDSSPLPSEDVTVDLEALTNKEAPAETAAKPDAMDMTDSFDKAPIAPEPIPAQAQTPTSTSTPETVKMSSVEEQDDLQSLKEDVGEVVFEKKAGAVMSE